MWVSALDGRSEPVTTRGQTVHGFVGWVDYRCDDRALADVVDCLFRLAPYCGTGSGKAKGLGVTRLSLGSAESAVG